MMRQVTATNNKLLFVSRRGRMLLGLMMMALIVLASVARINAQRVYGVSARRTTVVSNGSTAVARRTTAVSTGSTAVVRRTTVVGAARPAVIGGGYISVLPAGYRVVSGGYYMAGGIRYRAQFYQGRTVYVRV
jgi:hypothetical protein